MSIAGIKKGEDVVVLGFTGMKIGAFTVVKATKTELVVEKSDGSEMIFSRKTGRQTNVVEGKEKYANKIVHPDDAPADKPKKKAPTPKAKKAAKPVEIEEDFEELEEEDEEDFEEDEEEEPAPKKKPASKKAPAKSKKKVVVEDEDDDFEEI